MNEILKTNHEWKEYLQEGQSKTARSILEYTRRIYEFKEYCCNNVGGSDYKYYCKEWLGISSSTINKLSRIGRHYDELILVVDELPCSANAILKIVSVSKIGLKLLSDKVITKNSSAKEIEAHIWNITHPDYQSRSDVQKCAPNIDSNIIEINPRLSDSVYVIKCGDFQLFKVGKSSGDSKSDDRLANLQTGNPFELTIIFSAKVVDAYSVERKVQEILSAHCVRGEWFDCSLDIILDAIDDSVLTSDIVLEKII